MNQENVIKKAYQDCNPSRPNKNINQCNCNTDNKIKKVKLVSENQLRKLTNGIFSIMIMFELKDQKTEIYNRLVDLYEKLSDELREMRDE